MNENHSIVAIDPSLPATTDAAIQQQQPGRFDRKRLSRVRHASSTDENAVGDDNVGDRMKVGEKAGTFWSKLQ